MILTADEDGVNSRIIGHTHTPLPAGHKKYRKDVCECLIEDKSLKKLKVGEDGEFINFGKILAHYSEILCCVSKKHEMVTKKYIYPEFKEKTIYVTNGVYLDWASSHLSELIQRLKEEPKLLDVDANPSKPENKLLELHDLSKNNLSKEFTKWKKSSEVISNFDEINSNNFIFTYAKRLIGYKRADKLLKYVDLFDSDEITFIFAGRPIGDWGNNFLKDLIHTIKNSKKQVAYVLNYNREKARVLVQGSDVWINIPVSDSEACGTSFEKAILNGNILVSTPSGGVPEIIVDGKNGLIVEDDLSNLDKKLKEAVNILKDRERHARWIKDTISSSYFVTTHRMFDDYISKLYNLN
jgi:starch phosphorylase